MALIERENACAITLHLCNGLTNRKISISTGPLYVHTEFGSDLNTST